MHEHRPARLAKHLRAALVAGVLVALAVALGGWNIADYQAGVAATRQGANGPLGGWLLAGLVAPAVALAGGAMAGATAARGVGVGLGVLRVLAVLAIVVAVPTLVAILEGALLSHLSAPWEHEGEGVVAAVVFILPAAALGTACGAILGRVGARRRAENSAG